MGCDASRIERCGHGTVLHNGACEIVPTSNQKIHQKLLKLHWLKRLQILIAVVVLVVTCLECAVGRKPGQNDQCMKGIATFKQHGWPIPAQSQTNANRDGIIIRAVISVTCGVKVPTNNMVNLMKRLTI